MEVGAKRGAHFQFVRFLRSKRSRPHSSNTRRKTTSAKISLEI
jgi:hypothetical protein